MNYKIVLLIVIITSASYVWALPEIIINRDDVPFLIGQWANYAQNADFFMWDPFDSMRVWWDLTSYPGERTARIHLLHPSQGLPPAPDTFPSAKIVELDTMGSGDIVWTYLTDTTFFFYVQGVDYESGGFRFLGNYQPDYRCYAYPIYDGAGWNTAWMWTYEVAPGLPYTANETHQKKVVAKGKVRVPFSDDHFWPCLVIQDYMTYSDNFGSWDTRWIYEWVVPGRFGGGNGVAAAQSTNGAGPEFMVVENFFNLSQLYVPGWDLRCPDFTNTTIWPDTLYGGPFVVATTITDSTGVGADSLFYNINGDSLFLGVGHDSVNGDVYYYTIPEVFQSCTLGYLLWAEDSFSVANFVDIWNTDPICAPESTYYTFVATPGIEEASQLVPLVTSLTCTPNPFRGKLDIRWQMVDNGFRTSDFSLTIYDALGRAVRSFNPTSDIAALTSDVVWDASDHRGERLPNGIYFIELRTAQDKVVEPVVLIK